MSQILSHLGLPFSSGANTVHMFEAPIVVLEGIQSVIRRTRINLRTSNGGEILH